MENQPLLQQPLPSNRNTTGVVPSLPGRKATPPPNYHNNPSSTSSSTSPFYNSPSRQSPATTTTTPALDDYNTLINSNNNPPIFSKTFITFFLLFGISLAFTITSIQRPDWLELNPIFGYTTKFGLFKVCIVKNDFQTCYSFPNKDCKLPQSPTQEEFTLCQVWLSTRYLMITSTIFGLVAVLSWFLMIFTKPRKAVTGLSIWCTVLHALFQIVVMVLFIRMRKDEFFVLYGSYGYSFLMMMTSWILDILIVLILVTTLVVRRSTFEELRNAGYIQISSSSSSNN